MPVRRPNSGQMPIRPSPGPLGTLACRVMAQNGATYKADVVVIGGGLAGIAAARDLLEYGKSVIILDTAPGDRFGGLAKRSFGGVFIVDSPEQRRNGIADSTDLAFADWCAYGEFGEHDEWPRRWAEAYVHQCREQIRGWLREHKIKFFAAVHWAERGLFTPGNSVPRFHLTWGTGKGLVDSLVGYLEAHPKRDQLQLRFEHRVTGLETTNGAFTAATGVTAGGESFRAEGEAIVVAAGGIAGNLDMVRKHWEPSWGEPPRDMLNGSHPEADGAMLELIRSQGGKVTHLNKMWHYAAGVRHWKPLFEGHGLSLVPPKSALWVNHEGRRIGPCPLVGNFDTLYLVEGVIKQPKKYSWQLLNMRIARKEFAVSGAEFNAAVREKKLFRFLGQVLMGNPQLIQEFIDNCPDVLTAGSIGELAEKMNGLAGNEDVDPKVLGDEISRYDANVARGPLSNDDQLRRIAHARLYRGDKLRTCKSAPINDPRGLPLIAIHERIVTRKSLGGLQTDLHSRVLDKSGNPLPGLYAVGETAGFGGGGIHGKRSLEGTFLGGCILTGRTAAKAIAKGTSVES